MVTAELIEYIRGEFGKGRTREGIHAELIEGGGWSEEDLNEAFRIVIPMQDFAPSSVLAQGSSPEKEKSFLLWKIFLIIIVLVSLCFAIWWFYRAPARSLWNSLADKVSGLSFPSFDFKKFFNMDK